MNRKQSVFIDEYLKCFDGAEAARRAGYSVRTAREYAHDLLQNPIISSRIDARLAEIHMGADEALKLHADIARGDIGDLLDNNGLLDIRLAKQLGKTKLLRKIKQKTTTRIGKKEDDDDIEITEIEFEMYPADAAQERILKIHGKFTDKLDVTSQGAPISTKDDDDNRFNRAISSLAAALRESIPGESPEPDGEVDTAEQAAVVGPVIEG